MGGFREKITVVAHIDRRGESLRKPSTIVRVSPGGAPPTVAA